ncbi:peptidase associated/transthyretin-like domain-containing protein [Cochleicola gelatinilyticus]|uniref:Uncharacterized protein n=1 Tax=Cochleicola gelatinilyticus TaxID=1763537 RepID=A0A167IKP0_9FLAO|nr:hypothetical protein [Cochleicola gelatinilyticus]OAB79748.1 hypothetical protein ULVI_03105 [Cochleicola gelatinilyticus]
MNNNINTQILLEEFFPTFPTMPATQDMPYNTGITGGLIKSIQVVDVTGNPLEGVHVSWDRKGVVTDANGNATINATTPADIITISYTGKKTIQARLSDLGGLQTMQDEVITNDEVVLTKQQKANRSLLIGVLGAAAIFYFSYRTTKPKKAKGLAGVKTKAKKKKKASKTAKNKVITV